MSDTSPRNDLAALGRALSAAADGPSPPLRDVLAAHPRAADLLTDALLAGPATPAPEPAAPAAGEQRIGPYRIDGELGRGGQAVVYAAVDTRLGRPVALKVLHADAFLTPYREQRFRAEAATTSRLDHPGICPVFEIGEHDGRPFLAMRRITGNTLAELIRTAAVRHPSPLGFTLVLGNATAGDTTEGGSRHPGALLATLRLFESIAGALHAAHQAGVTHRDVKPGNVMVQPDGTAVVLDFGLAADEARIGEALTQTGDVFGTPAYMAPEQCRGERCDARSDVFALGATLFEALTGQRAFPGTNREAIVRAIEGGRVPDPRRLRRDLPPELGVVTQKALDPDPARRYATAEEFAQDLRRVRELRPILASPAGPWLRTRRWCQRNPWLVAIAGVLLVAGALTTWFAADASARWRENALVLMRDELAELVDRYPRLQPVAEHRAQAAAWLQQANALVARTGLVVAMRDELRRGGTQGDVDDLATDGLKMQGELRRLDAIEAARIAGRGTPALLAELAEEAPQHAKERERLVAAIAAQRTWHVHPDRQLLHDSCVRLIAALDAFHGPEGEITSLARELDNLVDAPVEWQSVIDDVRTSPVYRGLVLRPQRELLPLRKQPGTGLWEFAHPRSGPPPKVLADGSLAYGDDTGIVLVLLPGGATRVGSQATDRSAQRFDERIRGTEDYLIDVDLDPFFVAVHEITRAQWLRLAGRDPSFVPVGVWNMTERDPVTDVPWPDATEVLARSTLTLPTEAQWEYAARATEHAIGEVPIDANAQQLPENLFDASAVAVKVTSTLHALPGNDRFPRSAPVGSFAPNGFGLFDMRGNVQEWCLDPEAYPNRDVLGAGDGIWLAEPSSKHTIRGFGYLNDLQWSPLTTRAITADAGKDRGLRAARRLER